MKDPISEERLARAVLRTEIEAALVENAYLLDRCRFDELLELYTEDCEVTRPLPPFTTGELDTIRGRAGLAKWHADPAAWPASPRTMRHALSNLRIVTLPDGRVTTTITWTGFRHEGPGLSVASPMAVGDYEDEWKRGMVDGRWRIYRRKIVIAFLNQELLAVATAAVQRG